VTRRLKTDIPGPDRRVAPDEVLEKGWEALFAPALPAPLRLVVEIGFGRGEFLLDQAAREPASAFLGVDVSRKRVLKLARRLARTELANVRLVAARGEAVVDELLAPGSVVTFWVNFSDPWPKKRHHRRRLIQPAFVHALATRLAPGGTLHVATDEPGYAEWIDQVLPGEPLLGNAHAPAPHLREAPGRMQTAYEREWRERGRVPFFWTYRRISGRAAVAP
jgi:tRNA (guanine-N7-)-methyltransferase